MEISTLYLDANGKEEKMWTSLDRLYWTTEGKLTTKQYEGDPRTSSRVPLVLACMAGGQVPEVNARESGLLEDSRKADS